MIRRKTKERPFGATDERKYIATDLATSLRGRRPWQSILALFLLLILAGCTDYAAKMEDDFEEWNVILTDSRDGQKYKIVTIGLQTWMAQNLNYEAENSLCYNDDPANCATYGRLYTWAAAMTACPSGWHLPSTEEFETLFSAVGGSGTAGKMLKSTSGWYNGGNGTDDYAFSALPAGGRYEDGSCRYEGRRAYFWSSTEEDNSYNAYGMYLFYNSGDANLVNNAKNNGSPVRCLKD